MSQFGPTTEGLERSQTSGRATFFGTSTHKVSGRNQVALPKSLLRAHEQSNEGPLLLMRWNDEGYLRVYTQRQLDSKIDEVRLNEKIPQETRSVLIRHLAGSAEPIEPDKQGRFVLPAKWVEALGLKDEVVICGAHSRIEIWPAPAREDQEAREKEQIAVSAAEITGILDL